MANPLLTDIARRFGRAVISPQGKPKVQLNPYAPASATPLMAPMAAPPPTAPPTPQYTPGGMSPGNQQLQALMQLNADMRAGRTPRATNTNPANMYAQGINAARNEVQADGRLGRPGMGLLRNSEAQDIYARSGGAYMPTMTVGGAWGQPTPGMGVVTPTMERNQIRMGQVNARLGRNPTPGPLVQRTPEELDRRADAAGALVSRTPFAIPGTEINQGSQNVAYGGIGRRVNYDPNTNALTPTPEMRADMVRRGLLDQPAPTADEMALRRQMAGDARSQEMDRRRGLVQANAQQDSRQRDARIAARGQAPNQLAMMAQRNPAFALGYMKLMQEGRTAEANQLLAREQLDIERTKADAGMKLAEGNLKIGERNAATGELEARNRGTTLDNEQKRLAQKDAVEAQRFAEETAQQHEANAIAQEQSGDFRGAAESRERAARARGTGTVATPYRGVIPPVPGLGSTPPQAPPIGSAAGQSALAGMSPPPPNYGPIAGIGQAAPPNNASVSVDTLPQTEVDFLRSKPPTERAEIIRRNHPGISQKEIDDILKALAGNSYSASEYNPDGYGFSDFIGGLTGMENYNRATSWLGGDYKGPRSFSGAPVPVMPVLGALQTYLGW